MTLSNREATRWRAITAAALGTLGATYPLSPEPLRGRLRKKPTLR
jgi:hypothetical protein